MRCKLFGVTNITIIAIGLSASVANAGEVLVGPPTVLDSTTMRVQGKMVQLDFIKSLKPGNACTWKNRPLDCGMLAAAGLKDLVVGANVTCVQNISGKYTCTASGYDLAYGLIHAGWAVPTSNAPAQYQIKRARAESHKLGFWAARNTAGHVVAMQISTH
ncbi:MAG TPA: hypothetical protein ENJ55_00265 [Rhizobiales bacterium]|nr:hypothetical protein [Hyphomicrobiales bacterium]